MTFPNLTRADRTQTTLLIDADLFLYQAAAAAEKEYDWGDDVFTLMTDLKDAKKIFTDKMQFVTDTLGTDKMILCFSDKLNFRKVVSETYKANRKATRKPTGYRSFIRWAKDQHKFYWKPSLEADDCMGIMQTMPGSDTIIVSDDKDMRTIPGRLYRPMSDEMLEISDDEADLHFFTQCLTGDPTDGFPGLPGFGPKKAEALFKAHRASWSTVEAAYNKAGLTKEDALIQARLARILRWSDWDPQNNTYKLWEPEYVRG